MKNKIEAVHYSHNHNQKKTSIKEFSVEATEKVWNFHQSFPEYSATPLVDLTHLADKLGVKKILVKDESYRFGLNAFKVLGGSYCVGALIAEKMKLNIDELPFEKISSPEVKREIGELTFVTATDGNHGRGLAWTANRLGQKSVVYMAKGTAEERLTNIQSLGSDASILDLNYDDCVRYANEMAIQNDWVMVQDTAWEGYESIPFHIMQGYTTMANEIIEQLKETRPTHIFLQAGVGAMASAITAFFSFYYPEESRPTIVIVEPEKANCIFKTAQQADGSIYHVTGDMDTIMAGLACGEPSTISWNIIKDYVDDFLSIPEQLAAKGMRILGNPLGDDPKVVSGESGAAPFGTVVEILENSELQWLKAQLQLDQNSTILCISTEGDTDQENYRKIVWDGLFPSY
ncbi:MAG: diaminopropionate ammonia-lyase [Vagococcus sp.]|jgi:diaminopropionate ammonia-lyase|nr:diaminopropionate ammonia-lyase [Vagococcus sp.]